MRYEPMRTCSVTVRVLEVSLLQGIGWGGEVGAQPNLVPRHPIYPFNYIVVRREFVLYQSQLMIVNLRG